MSGKDDMSDGSTANSPQIELRKYPNRRYYDVTRSRHVTLEEIYSLIRSGRNVHVTDSKTGDDLTAKVLAQIILEHDPPKLGIFPVELLHQLIRTNEPIVRDFVEQILQPGAQSISGLATPVRPLFAASDGASGKLAAGHGLGTAHDGALCPAVVLDRSARGRRSACRITACRITGCRITGQRIAGQRITGQWVAGCRTTA